MNDVLAYLKHAVSVASGAILVDFNAILVAFSVGLLIGFI